MAVFSLGFTLSSELKKAQKKGRKKKNRQVEEVLYSRVKNLKTLEKNMAPKSKDQRRLEKAKDRADRLKQKKHTVPVELRREIQTLIGRVQQGSTVTQNGRGQNG